MSLGRPSIATLLSLLPLQFALAQSLPEPSRTAYKCESGGKTSYSDAPCLGAERVDLAPTRGLDKSSGSQHVGQDVAREVRREQFANAMKPVTGLGPREFEVVTRRQKLSPDALRRCQSLDMSLPTFERQAAQARDSARHPMQTDLLQLRTEYRRLGC